MEGSGPNLVLLHPVGLDLACWDAVAGILARDYTVLRPDLRGHGRSPAAGAGHSLEDYADDVHRLLAARAFAPATVVGLSFGRDGGAGPRGPVPGGMWHLSWPAAAPRRFPEAARAMMAQRAATAEQGGMAAIVEETLQRWFTPRLHRAWRRGADPRAAARRRCCGLGRRLARHQPAGRAAATGPGQRADPLHRRRAGPGGAPGCARGRSPGASRGLSCWSCRTPRNMMQIETPQPFAQAVAAFLSAHRRASPLRLTIFSRPA
ncbi:MAG: alpha/beta fold hydrolase [Acetobacteraceae bacterium]